MAIVGGPPVVRDTSIQVGAEGAYHSWHWASCSDRTLQRCWRPVSVQKRAAIRSMVGSDAKTAIKRWKIEVERHYKTW